ncbi:hypothetical protein ACH9L7_20350 (plasmid) [Haloferax sp. S1W]|uniref:hypothetical protein n=1 Tax=Haloferax sp. S1W TaxID=3377110 RepID=UPI0037C8C9F5
MGSASSLIGAVLQKFGRDGNGRVHEAPPMIELPDETYHVIYDNDTGTRFAHLEKDERGLYREISSIRVPHKIARYLTFEEKAGGSR